MADNITVKDGNNASVSMRTYEDEGVHTPYHIAIPLDGVLETGLVELIGADEAVSDDGFGASTPITLPAAYSGIVEQIVLVKTPGGVISPTLAGELVLFDVDPTILLNASDLSLAALNAVVAVVDVQASDWTLALAAGEVATLNVNIPFHAMGTIYAAFQNKSGSAINSVATDNVVLQVNLWFVRQS